MGEPINLLKALKRAVTKPLTEKHLNAAGRRLYETGGLAEVHVRSYCEANDLTDEQTDWVLAGYRAAVAARGL